MSDVTGPGKQLLVSQYSIRVDVCDSTRVDVCDSTRVDVCLM